MEAHDLAFEWQGLTLAGSLYLPSMAGPHPVVLMAQGSGASDRHSNGYFEPIRNTFVEHGIAVYSFDKPGCGTSTGDWHDYGLIGRAAQMKSALVALADHPAVDERRIGVWGHSQGGWIVQILAGELSTLAFAITSSAPTITVPAQIRYDFEHSLRARGVDEPAVARASEAIDAIVGRAESGADFASVRSSLESLADEPWAQHVPTFESEADWRHFSLLVSERIDPLQSLRSATCAFLAVYGGRDTLLPPTRSVTEASDALATSCDDATVLVFPQGDHRLHLENTTLVPGYLKLLGAWAQQRCQSPPT